MEFFDVIKARRSIRQFTSRSVSANEIMRLVDAAISAPNACNMQSWHFYVVTDKAVKERLAEEKTVATWATTAPVIFVVCTAADKICERFGEIGENLFAVQDTAAAIENILLCAADMGLGGCFMGAFDKEKCKEIVGIQDGHKPIAMVPVGEPANILPPRPRNPIESAVTFVGDAEEGSYRDTETVYRQYEVKNVKQPNAVFENVGMKGLKVKNGNLGNAEFDDVNLSGAKFNNVNLSGTSYSDINMKKCSYGGLTMEGSSFGCVEMKKCEFKNVELCVSKFENVTFGGADMKNVDMSAVDFESVDFSGANFDDVDFSGVDFGAADMSGANFDGADLSGASFCDVDLSGADFSGAAFDGGCEFNGATVDGINIAEAIEYYKENH